MKNWEKIIKDKLEDYEVNPPEGSLADFRQRLDASRNPSKKPTRGILPYIITAGVAAACLAFVVMMMQPEGITPSGEQPSIAKVANKNFISKPSVTADDSPANVKPQQNIAIGKNVARIIASDTATIDVKLSQDESAQEDDLTQEEQEPLIAESTQEEDSDSRFTQVQKTWMASGGILAATLGGAVLPSLESSGLDYAAPPCFDPDYQAGNPGDHKDVPVGDAEHSMPLKVGVSARWKFADCWSLTSGLEYSRYKSGIRYSLSGTKTQCIHYVGIPVRIDYSIANTRRIEVYLGAGGVLDYCAKATLGGEPIKKDGISFSLQGAGGVQLNITKHIGLFMEPQIMWFMPTSTSGNTLETYRTEHPISFNIATGVRYTIAPRKAHKQTEK